MKKLILAILMLVAAQAEARNKRYSCSNVGGVEERTIYIDLDKGLAGFFDNDTTTVVSLTDTKYLESFPPQWAYYFGGKDSGSSNGEQIEIYFNKTRLEASVQFFDAGIQRNVSHEARDGCKIDNSFTLDRDGV